ncbi:MAG: FAD-dependent oxidoreductase [Cyanobacteria bacterium P01_C01_bin.69]
MRIAIIGGGASGMISAYLLDQQGHEVTVYERQNILGGHIRTLNQNVSPQTGCAEPLEMGVLEFSAEFTNFRRLMEELDVPLEPVLIGSGLFFKGGRHFLSPVMINNNFQGAKKWRELLRLEALYAQSLGLWIKTHRARIEQLVGQPLSEYFSAENDQTTWMKVLTMYSYSMPYDTIDNFPAQLAIPALRRYVFGHWFRIKGGVYSYIKKILSRFSGEVNLGAEVWSIHRTDEAVQINGKFKNGRRFAHQFDKLVFAAPPDQFLRLVADPRPEEVQRFQAWKANYAQTVLHSDHALYKPLNIQRGSEFDFFQTDTGWGYNAYLNQLCGITSPTSYSLAFNLEAEISPEKIIHVQQHHTPFYDANSFRYRDEVIAANGQNNTYHVGAYLSDGLHEGAVTSAMVVADAIEASSKSVTQSIKQSQPQLVV